MSNTVCLVEVEDHAAVVWSKPEDLPFDTDMLYNMIRRRPSGFLVAMCDGSVHALDDYMLYDDERMKAMITRDGGEVVDLSGPTHGGNMLPSAYYSGHSDKVEFPDAPTYTYDDSEAIEMMPAYGTDTTSEPSPERVTIPEGPFIDPETEGDPQPMLPAVPAVEFQE